MTEPLKPPRAEDIIAKWGSYGGAHAMRTAMLEWIVERWPECVRAEFVVDTGCDDDHSTACTARKELER